MDAAPDPVNPVGPAGPSPLTDLVEAAAALAASATPGHRRVLGITGAPAAGKSTLAAALVDALGPGVAVAVPMDGFHLSNQTLAARGRLEAKGAPDTFDAGGYAALLERLRSATTVVHAPRFDRHLEESIGSAVPVDPGVPLVVTEGNYLLLDAAVAEAGGVELDADALAAWAGAREQIDQVWFVELDDAVRVQRLAARHVEHGRAPDAALARATGVDQANADLVAATRERADRVVVLG